MAMTVGIFYFLSIIDAVPTEIFILGNPIDLFTKLIVLKFLWFSIEKYVTCCINVPNLKIMFSPKHNKISWSAIKGCSLNDEYTALFGCKILSRIFILTKRSSPPFCNKPQILKL